MRLITFVLATLCALTAAAQTAGTDALVRAGTWLVTPQGNAGASVSYQLCFRTGSVDDIKLLLPAITPDASCLQPQIELAPGLLVWRLACPARSIQADARYALAAESIDGAIDIVQGSPAVRSTQTIKARLTGVCAS